MANDKVYKYYTELPGWAKGVVIIGGLGIAYIVGTTIYKKVVSLPALIDQKNKLDELNKDLDKKKQEGQAPSFSQTQYNNWADAIVAGFTPCETPGVPVPTILGKNWVLRTGPRRVYDILAQLKNDADFLSLQKAYGIRSIQRGWWCPNKNNMNLNTIVTDMTIATEKDLLNQVLAKKGISYRF